MIEFVRTLKVKCDRVKVDVEIRVWNHPKSGIGVVCRHTTKRGGSCQCRDQKGCALYEKVWFDGSIATPEQEKQLTEAHRKGLGLDWFKLYDEWLKEMR